MHPQEFASWSWIGYHQPLPPPSPPEWCSAMTNHSSQLQNTLKSLPLSTHPTLDKIYQYSTIATWFPTSVLNHKPTHLFQTLRLRNSGKHQQRQFDGFYAQADHTATTNGILLDLCTTLHCTLAPLGGGVWEVINWLSTSTSKLVLDQPPSPLLPGEQ